MKKSLFLFSAALLVGLFFGAQVQAATINAASCSYTDVSAAVASANIGDTVLVPAGSSTWTSSLSISKGVNLIGAGIGNTVITNGTAGHDYLIKYNPANYALDTPFRVSGFSYNLNNNGPAISLGVSGKTAPFTMQTHIRIDHNKFYNSGSLSYQAVFSFGTMDGLIDNNLLDGVWYPFRVATGNNVASIEEGYFANFYSSWGLGNEKTLYIENNTILDLRDGENNDSILIDCQYAAKGYVIRYNTISLYKDTYGLADAHGVWNPDMYGCFGTEMYGNKITALHTGYLESDGSVEFAAIRTGKTIFFYNTGIGAGNNFGFHYYYNTGGTSINCAPTYTAEQMIHDSYSWNNRKDYNGALGNASAHSDSLMTCNGLVDSPMKNRDWFTDSGASPLVSSGLLANISSTCTIGQGYWATNQSTSNLTGMVGVNPATPISGTLYKCTATNSWTPYYTPYIYPHPLTATSTMGTNSVDIGAGARVFGNGKFYNISSANGSVADLAVIPASGDVLTNWLDITVSTWQKTGTRQKTWTESSANFGSINTAHTIGDLKANTNYNVKVDNVLGQNIIGCSAGVCTSNESGRITFTYTGGYSSHTFDVSEVSGDITAPTVPTGLTATAISSSQINLSWTASSDAVGVSGYKIYRNGTQIATSASAAYNDATAVANTRYAYTVSAYDAVSNESSQSTALPVVLSASCTYADVSAAVTSASAGDTVVVPAGSATWTSTLAITKGIILKGAGIDNTILTNDIPWPNGYTNPPIIQYSPSNYNANYPFRLSGFTFNLGNNGHGIILGIPNKKAPFTIQTKIRVDHNRFTNSANISNQAIFNYGGIYGVADNNTFDNIAYPIRNSPDVAGSSWWDNFSLTFGAVDDNFYYEDNTFSGNQIVSDSQGSGRYVFRYNSITINKDAYPLFDMHGNGPFGTNATGVLSGMYSTFGGEIYGNLIDEGNYGMDLLDQRGGKTLVFFNRVEGSRAPVKQVREESPDSEEPTTNLQSQHVSDSYSWNNRWNDNLIKTVVQVLADRTAVGGGTNFLNYTGSELSGVRHGIILYAGTGAGQARNIIDANTTMLTVNPNWDINPDSTTKFRVIADYNGNTIHENSEFFNQGESFTGSAAVNTFDGSALGTGMGCGPLANRPAFCTPGVAYWATDQDCTQVSDNNIGVHPATLILGTLYKCSAPNVWTAYYTPYTYPHHLRTSGVLANEPTLTDTTAPSVPTNLVATPISTTQINLSWTASTDNIAVSGYRIYRNGTSIGTSVTNSYSSTGLTALTTYSYIAAAYDAADNVSASSSPISVTTLASDLTPPTGSVAINSNAAYTNNVSTLLTLLASDVSGVTQMKLSDISTNFSSLTALSFSSPYSWTLLGQDRLRLVRRLARQLE